jgi:hypothetical protein
VASVRERREFLAERLDTLAAKLAEEGREREVEELVAAVKAGQPLPAAPSDAEWGALLPKERDAALPGYYLRLRAEFVALTEQGANERRAGRLTEWLDGPVPKVVALAGTAATLGEQVLTLGEHVLRALGLGFEPPQQDRHDL